MGSPSVELPFAISDADLLVIKLSTLELSRMIGVASPKVSEADDNVVQKVHFETDRIKNGCRTPDRRPKFVLLPVVQNIHVQTPID